MKHNNLQEDRISLLEHRLCKLNDKVACHTKYQEVRSKCWQWLFFITAINNQTPLYSLGNKWNYNYFAEDNFVFVLDIDIMPIRKTEHSQVLYKTKIFNDFQRCSSHVNNKNRIPVYLYCDSANLIPSHI
jgi:hypothetical protein